MFSLRRNAGGNRPNLPLLAPLTAVILAFTGVASAGRADIEPYGFVRFDAIYDDSPMQQQQYAFWVLNEGKGGEGGGDPRATLHPRLTRLGLRITPYDIGDGAVARATVEVDFQNGGKESREMLRLRHGYFEIAAGDFCFLAGQTWDVIAPLFPAANNDGMMWNAGNLGDRRPQARVTWAPSSGAKGLRVAVAVTQVGAVDGADLDGNGTLDGIDGARPGIEGRIGIASKHREGGGPEIRAGIWGHRANLETATQVGGKTDFESWSAGGDLFFRLSNRFSFEGEAWTGKNLSDVRGGIGQGINMVTGRGISSIGGWAQLAVKPAKKWSLFIGATLDDPDDGDLAEDTAEEPREATGGDPPRTRNRALFGVVRFRPWPMFRLGVEYLNWKTEYAGKGKGTDNRFDTHGTFYF